MKRFWATRTPEQRQQQSTRNRDNALRGTVCFQKRWVNNKPTPASIEAARIASRRPKTRAELDEIAIRKTIAVSVKSIMKDLVAKEPHLIEQALRNGLNADPPRSYPYIALAAAYIDGRPDQNINVNATVQTYTPEMMSRLSTEELLQLRQLQMKMKAAAEAQALPEAKPHSSKEPVTIDVQPIRDDAAVA